MISRVTVSNRVSTFRSNPSVSSFPNKRPYSIRTRLTSGNNFLSGHYHSVLFECS